MWLIPNFGRKIRSKLHISWVCFLFCCTFLLMLTAIAKFRHECFHVQVSRSAKQSRGRCGITDIFKNEISSIDMSSPQNVVLDTGQSYEPLWQQKSLEKSEEKKENQENRNVGNEILEYFSSRRNSTKRACLEMFRKEDESQNKIVFEDEPQQTGSQSEVSTTKSSFVLGSESKFFMRATNPTRWIFYKPKSNQLELQWCPLYKSGSSSWMALFAKLSGALSEITERQIRKGSITFMQLANNFRMFHSSTSANLARDDKVKPYAMVVVRHPFKRILSAYRDKLERIKGREYYHKTIGKTIIQRFRRGGDNDLQVVNIFGRSFTIRRGKIISVTDYTGNNPNKGVGNQKRINSNKTTLANMTSGKKNSNQYNPDVPTFEEFCKYLISANPATMNEHWRPQYLDCSPCHHKFDLILKVEDIENDKIQVLKLLGFNNLTDVGFREIEAVWKRWTNRNVNGVVNESFYFSQLSNFLMKELYELYEPDFNLFGYSPDEYFSMTKNISR